MFLVRVEEMKKDSIKSRVDKMSDDELMKAYIKFRDDQDWGDFDQKSFLEAKAELDYMLKVIEHRKLLNYFSKKEVKTCQKIQRI